VVNRYLLIVKKFRNDRAKMTEPYSPWWNLDLRTPPFIFDRLKLQTWYTYHLELNLNLKNLLNYLFTQTV